MKKFYLNQLLALLFFAFVGVSCSEDEEVKVDPRDQAVGSYMGTTLMTNGTDEEEASIILMLIADPDNEKAFTLIDEDGVEINAEKVTKTGNGMVFNIPSQDFIDGDGDRFSIEGSFSADFDGHNYHGMFNSDKNEISFAASIIYEKEELSMYNHMIITRATKL